MNIDWSKVPEDATHAGATTRLQIPVFYKDIREDKYSYWYADGDGWREDAIGRPACTPLIERPKKQEAWNGVGLPPVGIECEVLWSITHHTYVTCLIIAHDEGSAVFRFTSGPQKGVYHSEIAKDAWMPFQSFRPIKTAEQLAEEERDKARTEVLNAMISNTMGFDTEDQWQQRIKVVGEMLDMGYRKQ